MLRKKHREASNFCTTIYYIFYARNLLPDQRRPLWCACMSRAAVAGSIGRLLFFKAGKAKFASPPTKLMDEILMLKIRGIFYSSNRYMIEQIVDCLLTRKSCIDLRAMELYCHQNTEAAQIC